MLSIPPTLSFRETEKRSIETYICIVSMMPPIANGAQLGYHLVLAFALGAEKKTENQLARYTLLVIATKYLLEVVIF